MSSGSIKVYVDPSVKHFKQSIEKTRACYPNTTLKVSIAITASAPHDPTCGKLLLVRRRRKGLFDPRRFRGVYELPGGLIQSDDGSVISAVLRQVHADTGLKVLGVLGTFDESNNGE